MATELKPCPFCGGEAEFVYLEAYENEGYIVCKNGCIEQRKIYNSTGEAIEAWNRRAEDAEV